MKTEDYHAGMKRLAAALADVPDGAVIARRLVRLGLGGVSDDALGVLCHYLTGAPLVAALVMAAPAPVAETKAPTVKRRRGPKASK